VVLLYSGAAPVSAPASSAPASAAGDVRLARRVVSLSLVSCAHFSFAFPSTQQQRILRVFFKDGTYRSYVLTAYVIRSASTTTTTTTNPRFIGVCVCRVCGRLQFVDGAGRVRSHPAEVRGRAA
jgi:hypothetical protein